MNNKPYTLTFYSWRKPDHPNDIQCSVQMIAYYIWEAFSKLQHVEMRYFESEDPSPVPQSDFSLVHDYFQSAIYRRLPEIRANTSKKITTIMESPFDSPLIDRDFTFLPIPRPNATQIRLPCPMAALMAHNRAKRPGSVLLDHQWIERGVQTDLPLYRCVSQMNEVAQLRRPGRESQLAPDWVITIPKAGYIDYLDATACYETFILTHPGSYEHSIIDMAARGARVFVPVRERPFCHPSIVEDLGLFTFRTSQELRALLEGPPANAIDRFTDMPDVVARIDEYFQQSL